MKFRITAIIVLAAIIWFLIYLKRNEAPTQPQQTPAQQQSPQQPGDSQFRFSIPQ